MAKRYPFASWRPLGPQSEGGMDRHDIVCVHTMVGYLSSTDAYFRSGNGAGYDGTESHYGIGGLWGGDVKAGLDGVVWQWQDRRYRADANLDGNGRVISIETADNCNRPIAPWTAKQVAALIKLIAWECSPAAHAECPAGWRCRVEGIPAKLIPDTLPTRRGIGYHAQGSAEHTAGEWWSRTQSKDCPTDVRIRQLKTTVIPGVQRLLAGVPTGDEFDMATLDDLADVVRGVFHLPESGMGVPQGQLHNGNVYKTLVTSAQGTYNSLAAIQNALLAVKADTRLLVDDQDVIVLALQEVEARIIAAIENLPH